VNYILTDLRIGCLNGMRLLPPKIASLTLPQQAGILVPKTIGVSELRFGWAFVLVRLSNYWAFLLPTLTTISC